MVPGSNPGGPIRQPYRRDQETAFSLAEVSLALVLAAFALVAVLGALPAGLRAVQEAQSQEIAANVAQRLQGSLQQISFADHPSGTTTSNLSGKTYFYTLDGVETADPATADPMAAPAYYKAIFSVGDALFDHDPLAQGSNARAVTITLWYPQSGTAVGRQRYVYSFLVAKQTLD